MLSKRVLIQAFGKRQLLSYTPGTTVTLYGVRGVVIRQVSKLSIEVEWDEHSIEHCLDADDHVRGQAVTEEIGERWLDFELRDQSPTWVLIVNGRSTNVHFTFRDETNDAEKVQGELPEGVRMDHIQKAFGRHATLWNKARERTHNRQLDSIRDYQDPTLQR